jgi:catechol 2,3-dioxygenase-like lactoylglutathione lyase family enzyme
LAADTLPRMPKRYVHTCLRARDPEASERFYRALGFERRGRLNGYRLELIGGGEFPTPQDPDDQRPPAARPK